MNSSTTNRNSNARGLVAPRLGVVLAVVIGLAGLIFLIPDRDQLLKRFLADGNENAASGLLGEEGLGDPAAVTRSLTLEILTLGERSHWNDTTVEVLTGFLRQNGQFSVAAKVVMENAERLPAEVRATVFATLIDRSLAEGDLAHAVSAQEQLLAQASTLTPALVRQAVTTFRYNGEPARALDLINRLQDQSAALPRDLKELRVTLARETSQPDVAFRLLAIKVRATRDRAELKKLIPQAVKVGVEAGQMETLIPLYRRYIATFREDKDPLVRDYSFRVAQTYEWTGQPDRAFETYLPLAEAGDREALDRVLKLNAGLFRSEEVLELLVGLGDTVRQNDQLLALTARLLAEAARRDEAVACYELLLKRQPDNADAHYRLGLVHDERMDFDRAVPHLLRAHELEPDNVEILHRLARIRVARNEYAAAIQHFERLITISDDPEFAEELNTIAYSLNETSALKRSLNRLMELKPGPVFAMALADLHREEGNDSEAIAVLEDSLEQIENDLPVRLELAQLLIGQKRPDRALRILSPVSLSEFPDAVPLVANALGALPASSQASALPAALRKHGPALARSEALLPGNLIDLANLERRFGSASRGQQLFRRALRECSEPNHLAQAHFGLGNTREALRHQLAFIKNASPVVSEDYHFLGDLYAALGQRTNAESAYRYAVVLLKKRLTRTPQR